jgi:hypothetical protein
MGLPEKATSERPARMNLPVPLNSLWIGEELGYVERLTLISALAVGHSFRLYSYAPDRLRGVPSGVEICDANEVVAYSTLADCFEGGWAALGADFFRYTMQAAGLGCWVDLDLCFVRAIDFQDDYVFGWEHESSINGAVLRLPPDSAMVRELSEIPRLNWRPPFYGPRKTTCFYLRRLIEGDIRPEKYRWGTFGPAYLTHLAKKYRLYGRAQERSVFYPLRHRDAKMVCGAAELVESQLTQATRTVHLWRSVLSREALVSPPPGSYLEAQCRRHGVEV